MTTTEARLTLDLAILDRMASGSAEWGVEETCYFLRHFEMPGIIDRELARALLRNLTDRGFCRYQRGLFGEDGMVAGSGYGITRRGRKYRAALEELLG